MRDLIALGIVCFFLGVLISIGHVFTQPEKKKPEEKKELQFIWNDDEESIPRDGSLIKIEFTDGNNIYIGPTDQEITTNTN